MKLSENQKLNLMTELESILQGRFVGAKMTDSLYSEIESTIENYVCMQEGKLGTELIRPILSLEGSRMHFEWRVFTKADID